MTMTATPVLLDEKAKRRPGFREGEDDSMPLTLADGQVWRLVKPTSAEYRFKKSGDAKVYMARSFGPDYDTMLDRYVDAADGVDSAIALFEIAYYLLEQNYAITFDEVSALFVRIGNPDHPRYEANRQLWQDINDLAIGQSSKKATPAG